VFTKKIVVACANFPLSMIGLFSTASVVELKSSKLGLNKSKRDTKIQVKGKTPIKGEILKKYVMVVKITRKNLEILNLYSREFLSLNSSKASKNQSGISQIWKKNNFSVSQVGRFHEAFFLKQRKSVANLISCHKKTNSKIWEDKKSTQIQNMRQMW